MLSGRQMSSDLYERALSQFLNESRFYVEEVRTFLLDLTMGERLLGLCAFIMFLMYLIVSRARRKYNPGSYGRQFAAAVLLVGIVVYGSSIMFGDGAGSYRRFFEI